MPHNSQIYMYEGNIHIYAFVRDVTNSLQTATEIAQIYIIKELYK